jgi:hypothetical protein
MRMPGNVGLANAVAAIENRDYLLLCLLVLFPPLAPASTSRSSHTSASLSLRVARLLNCLLR